MKKVFYLAAVALVALAATMNLTSCNDDDDDADGSYKMTYRVSVIAGNLQSQEVQAVMNSYSSAMGVTVSTLTDEIVIKGADKAACDAQFLSKAKQANTDLSKKTWSETIQVDGYVKGDTLSMFTYTYATGDNASSAKSCCVSFTQNNWNYAGQNMGIANLTVKTTGSHTTAADYALQQSSSLYWYFFHYAMSDGAFSAPNHDKYCVINVTPANGSQSPVTDIIAYATADNSAPSTIQIEGRNYKNCGNLLDDSDNSADLYLYVTTDYTDGSYVDANSLRVLYTDKFVKSLSEVYYKKLDQTALAMAQKEVGQTGKVVPMYMNSNGATIKYGDCNLNFGAQGFNYFLYFATCK